MKELKAPPVELSGWEVRVWADAACAYIQSGKSDWEARARSAAEIADQVIIELRCRMPKPEPQPGVRF